MDSSCASFLVVQAGDLRCAVPLSLVREIMRPLPIRTVAGLLPAVLGMSVVRGAPIPVVSLSRLLHQPQANATRFVVLRTAGRDCALAVEQVHDIASMSAADWEAMPSLFSRVESAAEIHAEDQDLVVSLNMARLMAELPAAERPLR